MEGWQKMQLWWHCCQTDPGAGWHGQDGKLPAKETVEHGSNGAKRNLGQRQSAA